MKLRDNKGSITMFVLVGLLFMTGFLIISFGSNINKSKGAKEQFNILTGIYSYGDTDADAYDRAYTAIRKKNAQILTQSSKNSNTLELTKTFTDDLSDYKIYGNSVQNGTPSPDNPVEIQSVGDKTVNLFNGFIENTRLNADTGAESYGTNGATSDYIKVDFNENDSYYLSGLTNTLYSFVAAYNEEKEFLGRTTGSGRDSIQLKKSVFTYGSPETTGDIAYIRITQYENINITGKINDLNESTVQLQIGDISTDYEPYGKYKITVRASGKNLLNKFSTPLRITGCEIEQLETGIRMKSTDINTYKNIYLKIGTAEELKGKTLCFQANINKYNYTGEAYNYLIYGNTTTFTQIADSTMPNNGLDTIIATVPNEATGDIIIRIHSDKILPIDAYIDLTNLQVTIGTETSDYEHYVEPIIEKIYLNEPLRKVGNYSDYIDFSTGTVERVIKKLVFNGTESWVKSTMAENRFTIVVDKKYATDVTAPKLICDRLKYTGTRTVGTIDVSYTSGNPSGSQLVFGMEFGTLEEFKQYVVDEYNSETPMYILYALYEKDDPETIDLPELKTFEDYTKIEVLTSVAPSKIEATYYGYTME